ncbi:MAG TPA: DUF4332 domain-containing protein [Acidimicrobiia bacterium]|nr:DUF4332 domain-containing protein [Acidimicrobiia bacterium]
MTTPTRENIQKAAYAAVGAPVAAVKSLYERMSDLRDIVRSSRQELGDDLTQELASWVDQGEEVIEQTMSRLRSRVVGVGLPDADLTRINGVGPSYAERLQTAGVESIADFVSGTSSSRSITKLAEISGVSAGTIASWREQAELTRVDGVGGSYQTLLRRAGVWTVQELSVEDPEALTRRLGEIDAPDAPDQTPSIYQVRHWVHSANVLLGG